MAVRTRKSTKATPNRSKASKSQVDQAAFASLADEEYTDINVLEYGSDCMIKYGLKTLEGRAIPDYRDGLIPVQRRILWAMYRLPKTLVKSARVVGDVIGKYHPHGDSAVYGSIVTMVQAPAQFIVGDGNWGSYDNPKSYAAMRYTECILSPLARAVFFSGSLTKAYDLVPNFDGSEKEPMLLHCNIPAVLVLGKMGGIAVGLTCNIPSFTIESVIKISKLALQGKKITPKMCRDILDFNFSWGGKLNPKHLSDGSYDSVLKTGRGNLTFLPDYEYNEKEFMLTITGMPPKLSYETAVKNTIKNGYSFSDGTTVDSNGKLEINISLRKSRTDKPTKADLDKVLNIWSSETIPVRVSAVERTATDAAFNEGVDALDVSVIPNMGIADLINRWAEYRLGLEKVVAKIEREEHQEVIRKLDLIILARENFDVIKKALEQENSAEFIAKKLKIDLEDAKYIMARTLTQLSKTDIEATHAKIAEIKSKIKACTARIKNPSPSAIEALEAIADLTSFDTSEEDVGEEVED